MPEFHFKKRSHEGMMPVYTDTIPPASEPEPCICVTNIFDNDPETGEKKHCHDCEGTGTVQRGVIQCASCHAPTPIEEEGVDHICLRCEIDRLKQERDELVAQVDVMRAALRRVIGEHCAPNDCYSTDPLHGDIRDILCPSCEGVQILDNLTHSSALREIQARTLEDILNQFVWFSSKEGLWLADAIQAMAAAKRKGEPT